MWRYFILRSSRRFSHKDNFDRRSLMSDSSFHAFSTNSMTNSSSLAIKASSNSRSSLLRFSASEIFACSSSICYLHEATIMEFDLLFILLFNILHFYCLIGPLSGGIPSSYFRTNFLFDLPGYLG